MKSKQITQDLPNERLIRNTQIVFQNLIFLKIRDNNNKTKIMKHSHLWHKIWKCLPIMNVANASLEISGFSDLFSDSEWSREEGRRGRVGVSLLAHGASVLTKRLESGLMLFPSNLQIREVPASLASTVGIATSKTLKVDLQTMHLNPCLAHSFQTAFELDDCDWAICSPCL